MAYTTAAKADSPYATGASAARVASWTALRAPAARVKKPYASTTTRPGPTRSGTGGRGQADQHDGEHRTRDREARAPPASAVAAGEAGGDG